MDFKLPDGLSDDELNRLQDKYIEEYNQITAPYRVIFSKIEKERADRYNRKIISCDHVWEKEAGCFHNDRYYFCKKCGAEK